MNDLQIQNLKIGAIAGAVVATGYQLMFNMDPDAGVMGGLGIAFLLFAAVGAATFFGLNFRDKR